MNREIKIQVTPALQLSDKAVQRLVALVNEAYSRHNWLFPEDRTQLERFQEEAANKDLILLLDPTNENIVGTSLIHTEGDALYFAMAAIDPAQQGKGLAVKLLQMAEEVARQRGLRKLKLLAALEIGNVDYYLRRGFEVTSEKVNPIGTWGSLRDYTVATMEKELV